MKTKFFYILTLLSMVFHSCNKIDTHNDKSSLVNMGNKKINYHWETENSIYVQQTEIGLTSHMSEKYILGTSDAELCVIVAFYNPSTKEAGLSLIDDAGLNNVENALEKIKCELTKNSSNINDELLVYVSTPIQENNITLNQINQWLSSHSNTKLVKTFNSTYLTINAKNGDVIIKDLMNDLKLTVLDIVLKKVQLRLNIEMNFPYEVSFDGREKISPYTEYTKEKYDFSNNDTETQRFFKELLDPEICGYLVKVLEDKSSPALNELNMSIIDIITREKLPSEFQTFIDEASNAVFSEKIKDNKDAYRALIKAILEKKIDDNNLVVSHVTTKTLTSDQIKMLTEFLENNGYSI